ncbi:uncharacterized protein STEHIDRAFT_162074 [Stereum hirsutum FP-91666 SS1]|uniref:uncharacterized protein n=1 Tax=Stereum hirsutum (strain FP-91666) TaxID=721885 RepID=UPI00044498E8|nr:uncharacterized protein STEHIDRAFT_162074 [Stereum hirsutum FP-91666 SS1]EIM81076.1 hypothetical protein STEHIDRAFT_162074 [Stereum hirsutum FP-91666 SS1]
MHHALSIPEILTQVFSELDQSSNCATARVCKQWSPISLDEVWRDVFLGDVFRSLGQMRLQTDHSVPIGVSLIFVEPILVEDWTLFLKNTRRVRHVKDPLYFDDYPLSSAAVQEILSSRTSAQIFPNLRSIRGFILGYSFEPMFMSNNVLEIAIVLKRRGNQWPTIEAFHKRVLLIINRMPNIERLSIISDSPFEELEEDISLLISRLPTLIELRFPVFCLRPTITRVAAGLRRLKTLEVTREYSQLEGSENTTYSCMLPRDVDDPYPALRHLSFAAHRLNVLTFMRPLNRLNLTTFGYHMLGGNSWLVALPEDLERPGGAKTSPTFGLEVLSLICRFPRLKSFSIHAAHPLNITEEQLSGLATGWTAIEELDLNKTPLIRSQSSLPLKSLLHFRNCRNLRFLGRYLRIDDDDEFPSIPSHPDEALMFPYTVIDLGSSSCKVHYLNCLNPLFLRDIALLFAAILRDPNRLRWNHGGSSSDGDDQPEPDERTPLEDRTRSHSIQSITAFFRTFVKERVVQDMLKRELAARERSHAFELQRAREDVESLRRELQRNIA